jgi:hypothetical protein
MPKTTQTIQRYICCSCVSDWNELVGLADSVELIEIRDDVYVVRLVNYEKRDGRLIATSDESYVVNPLARHKKDEQDDVAIECII